MGLHVFETNPDVASFVFSVWFHYSAPGIRSKYCLITLAHTINSVLNIHLFEEHTRAQVCHVNCF